MAESETIAGAEGHGDGASRRDFLFIATGAFAAVGGALAVWPFIDSMNPAADTLALSSVEVDLTPIALGQRVTIKWRGKPIFVDHRTAKQIAEARAVKLSELRDPALDKDRVKKSQWLIVIGICTHLGCIPKGQKPGEPRGAYGGWYCACHGSQYDTAGRIRKGPAPENLWLPEYKFVNDHTVKIG